MRRILAEHARRKKWLKHGGTLERLDIENLEEESKLQYLNSEALLKGIPHKVAQE